MKTKNLMWVGLIAAALPVCAIADPAVVAPVPSPVVAQALQPNVSEVIKLLNAGIGNDVVLAYVNSSQSMYNLSANGILQLKDSGVSPAVITAMLNHDAMLRGTSQMQYATQPPPAPPANVTEQGAAATATTTAPPVSTATATVVQPAPQVEYVPPSPGADYYWDPGYYGYDGLWVPGAWWPVGFYGWGWGWGRGGWGWGFRGGGFRGGFRGGGFHDGGFHGGGGFRGGGGFHGGGGHR